MVVVDTTLGKVNTVFFSTARVGMLATATSFESDG
jgi:hypothetical protein